MGRFEDETREYLTRQQRNLLLAEPIARLSLDRRVIFRDDPAMADLDVQYLALSAIDFVMERSAIESGAPPAALLEDDSALVDYTLFWITCKDSQEANYLLAIINSQALYEAVSPMMAKGQFGARHLQKHLWKLSIPEFDHEEALHAAISEAGRVAAVGAARQLAQLRQDRGEVPVTIARREVRKWLRESKEGKAAEEAVGKLLARKSGTPPSGGR